MKAGLIRGLLISLAFANVLLAQPATQLRIGQAAPPLSLQHWLSGPPVTGFDRGSWYVVEMTSTWCAPCIKEMPHVFSLAQRYKGQIKFVVAYALEAHDRANPTDLKYVDKVRRLCSRWGDQLPFASVGIDGHSGKTRDDWKVYAATTFIVDNQGRIAWMGRPFELEGVLSRITAGTFGSSKESLGQLEFAGILERVDSRIKSGEAREVVKQVDSLLKAHPDYAFLYKSKFKALAALDEDEANGLVKALLAKQENVPWSLMMHDIWQTPRRPDYTLALRVVEAAMVQDTLYPDLSATLFLEKVNIYQARSRTRTQNGERDADLALAGQTCRDAIVYCEKHLLTDLKKLYAARFYDIKYKLSAGAAADEVVREMLDDTAAATDWYGQLRQMMSREEFSEVLALEVASRALAPGSKRDMMAEVKSRMATLYGRLGQSELALASCREAISISESLRNPSVGARYRAQLARLEAAAK